MAVLWENVEEEVITQYVYISVYILSESNDYTMCVCVWMCLCGGVWLCVCVGGGVWVCVYRHACV